MIEKLFLQVFGYSVFFGLLYAIWKANARRWSRLAKEYGASEDHRADANVYAKQTMQTVILVGGHVGWNSYKGIATVSVTPDGIMLSLMPPFSIFHQPLLIPFRDSSVQPRRWYLFGTSYQYTLAKVDNVQIIVCDDLQGWIETQAASLAAAVG